MKKFFRSLMVLAGALFMASAFAQSYPYTTSTYIPNAIGPSTTFAAPGDYTFRANNLAVTSLQVSGTCTSLAAVPQGSNDNTNWTTLTMHGLGTGTAASAVSAAGAWRISSAGLPYLRLHITALTASGTNCTVTMAGTQAGTGSLE